MKHTLLIITALMLVVGFTSGQEPIDGSTLVWKNGKPYSLSPYSGVAVEYYDNGLKFGEGTWKNGKEVGLFTSWYENGQIRSEETYKDGELDGKLILWYEDGQKGLEGTHKNGKLIEWTEWDEDGNKR